MGQELNQYIYENFLDWMWTQECRENALNAMNFIVNLFEILCILLTFRNEVYKVQYYNLCPRTP